MANLSILGGPEQQAKHLRDCYINSDAEKARQVMARKRIDLFNDNGSAQIDDMLNDVFANAKVRSLRKKFAELAAFQNLTKRIVREVSSVYSEPATRTVKSGKMLKNYRRLQRDLRLDRRMRLANQMVNLNNDVVLWFDIRDDRPYLRVVTPDVFWAICHPSDPTYLIGVMIDQAPPKGRAKTINTPAYFVMDDSEQFFLNEHCNEIPGSRKKHGLSRMPMLLVHRQEPSSTLLSPNPGKDIVAAHKALALVNTMMLKHQKSGTKQAVASGDLGDMAQGQPMDPEHVLQSPDGVSWQTLDLGANPDSYISVGRAIIKQIAANYGIPESVFDLSYQATSGFEIELKRTGLREVRRDQILDWRPVEEELALIMEEILSESSHPLAFNATGWSIDFGEVETPRDPMQMLGYWEKLRQMGLMNTVEMYVRLNPEADELQALAAIRDNAAIEAERVELYRRLNISPDTAADGSGGDGSAAPFNGSPKKTVEEIVEEVLGAA